jgi:excisionase family DNA binding protein
MSNALTDPKLAYSVPEAARASGLSRSGLYVAIRAGELPIHKSGRRSIVLADDLRAYLERLPTAGGGLS